MNYLTVLIGDIPPICNGRNNRYRRSGVATGVDVGRVPVDTIVGVGDDDGIVPVGVSDGVIDWVAVGVGDGFLVASGVGVKVGVGVDADGKEPERISL
jgi:hypothetical protein